ncbi:MAG: phosphomannomutase/phosphoglucomutase, partial [Giesbergeria sp.]
VVNTIDGLRVDWPDGFGLIRASNTTPVLVLRFEGQTPEALARIEAGMLALLRRAKPDAQLQASAH